MNPHLAPVYTDHLEPIRELSALGVRALAADIANHFIAMPTLDRETLLRYVGEAGAL